MSGQAAQYADATPFIHVEPVTEHVYHDDVQSSQEGLLTIPSLTPEALKELTCTTSDVLAIRVPNYYSTETCERLVNWMSEHPDRNEYSHELYDEETGEVKREYLGVDRIGTPFNSTYNRDRNDFAVRAYYDDVEPFRQQLTAACHPEENLMSKVMKTLDENWSAGAEVAKFEGEEMNAGIIRITTSNNKTEIPHVDCLPSEYKELDIQLSTNVFLAAPPVGGELVVYRTRARTFEEIAALPADVDWNTMEGMDSPLLIQPNVGDLLLINTRRPHSTNIFPKGTGPRISVACFIGCENEDSPLYCWT